MGLVACWVTTGVGGWLPVTNRCTVGWPTRRVPHVLAPVGCTYPLWPSMPRCHSGSKEEVRCNVVEVRRKRAARACRREDSLGLDHRHRGRGSQTPERRGHERRVVLCPCAGHTCTREGYTRAAKPPAARACQGSTPFPQEHTDLGPDLTGSGYLLVVARRQTAIAGCNRC